MSTRDSQTGRAMWLGALAIVLTLSLPRPSEAGPSQWGESLGLRLKARPQLLDYEIPDHSSLPGQSQAGLLLSTELVWVFDRHVSFNLGALGRLPFAHDFEAQLGIFPLVSVEVRPDDALLFRLGTLDIQHGFHAAVLDEFRFAYGRDYEATYNRSIPEDAAVDLGGDPFMPVETGVQMIAETSGVRAEVYLDWQLLETEEHREKFALGVLADYRHRWFEVGFQYRLLHYGGQLFTAEVPDRANGLDPKRQPTTLALHGLVRPLDLGWLKLELPLAFVHGRVVQAPGEPESSHWGFEPGVDVGLFDLGSIGYRLWWPEGGEARFVSEDSDPVYAGPRSHRLRFESHLQMGLAEIGGHLDIVFPEGTAAVQTLATLAMSFTWEPVFWRAPGLTPGSDGAKQVP